MLDRRYSVERFVAILAVYLLNGYNMRTLLRAKRNLDQALIAVIERQNKVILILVLCCHQLTRDYKDGDVIAEPLSGEIEVRMLAFLALCITYEQFPKKYSEFFYFIHNHLQTHILCTERDVIGCHPIMYHGV